MRENFINHPRFVLPREMLLKQNKCVSDINRLNLIMQILLLCFALSSCNLSGKKYKTPPEYDLNKPDKFVMPGSLLEISGISFYKGKNDTVYAIQDEDGKVFRLPWGTKKSYPTKFAKRSDYEDVTLINEQIYVLRSDGTIFSFPRLLAKNPEPGSIKEWKNVLPISEYEGIYGEESSGKLYVLCKKCKNDDNTKKLSGFVIDTRDALIVSSVFSINVAAIQTRSKTLKSGYRPSALAKNPITGEWFILSGSNKLLVVTHPDFTIKETYPLNGNKFNQAEGMAFDAKGNLYISNEGEEDANGNILFFKRN